MYTSEAALGVGLIQSRAQEAIDSVATGSIHFLSCDLTPSASSKDCLYILALIYTSWKFPRTTGYNFSEFWQSVLSDGNHVKSNRASESSLQDDNGKAFKCTATAGPGESFFPAAMIANAVSIFFQALAVERVVTWYR